jgi:hypothetical protein
VFADASLPISFDTLTRSRWPAKAYRSSSSNASSGTATLGITSVYLQGIDNAEIIETVHARRAPMIAVTTSLRR